MENASGIKFDVEAFRSEFDVLFKECVKAI